MSTYKIAACRSSLRAASINLRLARALENWFRWISSSTT